MNNLRFGIDLGGTKIEIIGLEESESGLSTEVYRKRVATPKNDYPKTLKCIANLVVEAEELLRQQGRVGIGIPGAVSSKTGRVKNANSTCLIGEDLQGDLQSILKRDIPLANDANCFALSEAIDGNAQGAQVVFGVIIGTGCGGGLVVNGEVVNGINAIGGEWGHNPLPWADPSDTVLDCYCGLKGCNETYLSGTGFEAHYAKKIGRQVSSKNIVEQAFSGDSVAMQHLDNYTVWLAKGLASVINIVDPDVIVLGGGMSNVDYLYSTVPNLWQQWVFSDRVDTKLVPPKYGDSSGVRGAAWL